MEVESGEVMKAGPCPFAKGLPNREAQFCDLLCSRFLHLVSGHPDRHKTTQNLHYSISKSKHGNLYYTSGKQSSKMNQKPMFKPLHPVIPLLGIYPKEIILNIEKMFIHKDVFAMSFIIARL